VIDDRAPALEARQPSARRARLEALAAPPGEVSAREQPFMLATLEEHPFSRPGWLFEIKYDGVRVFASRRGQAVELRGRSGQIVTARYPEIAAGLRALAAPRFLIDGEIVALDEEGRSSFQRLQARMGLTAPRDIERASAQVPVTGIFFDCLSLDGYDLRRLPLSERKECLRLVVPPLGPVRYGDHVLEDGLAFFEAASEQRLEGIVAKRAASPYVAGRSRDWIKIKCQQRQEFVIGGYTDPQGARGYFGALHLGVYEDGRLVYVSKVGTGFGEATLARVWKALQPLARPCSPFEIASPTGRGHHWVEPRLVCEVRFTDWTRDGGIRHPAFMGLRSDKRPEECRRETPAPARAEDGARRSPGPAGGGHPPGSAALGAPGRGGRLLEAPTGPGPGGRSEGGGDERVVRITNPGKVFWPAEGYTKGDLVAYYREVAPLLLPYLRDRPLVLTRYPDGIAGKSFFQTDAPASAPSWVRTARVYSADAEREIDYFVVNDAETLAYVVNLGTIPLHVWASRLGAIERPDWLVLDLDPKGARFTDVVAVAQQLHRILDDIGLPSYAKTSGATGLHILVPLGARYTHEDARTFARLLAVLGAQAMPETATVARPIHARGGKVYLDFGQNGHGKTIVAPYSVRPRPGAPASCPLAWTEVDDRLDPSRFTIKTVPERFRRRPDPLVPVLGPGIDMAAAIARLEERVR
jgi:bifunctional non-homologous end joining protein LigD